MDALKLYNLHIYTQEPFFYIKLIINNINSIFIPNNIAFLLLIISRHGLTFNQSSTINYEILI